MNDINLLPEELRADEERLANQLPGPKPAASWHLPALPRREVGAGQGGPGNGSNQALAVKPLVPANGQSQGAVNSSDWQEKGKGKGKVLSAGPPKVRQEVKPQAPIFDLDAEAENSPAPGQILAQEKKPDAVGPTQRTVAGSGLLGKMLGQKNASIRRLKPSEFADRQGFGKSVDVNLIPEGSDLLPNRHFYPYFFYAAFVGLAVLGLLFLGLALYQQRVVNQEKAVTAKVIASETAYNQLKAKEEALSAWSTKAAAIQSLFDNHVYWTKFFEALQSVTTPDVYYSDINTAVDGTVSLSAGANSYVAVAKQFLAYQQAADLIQEVSLADIAGDLADGKITFTVKLQFAPTVFFLTLNNN